MKTLLVTGGSRGIGKAIVELFSKNGYSVAFTYKNSENEAKNLAETTGALAIRADSSSEADVLTAVSMAEAALGHIDCLINNAGIASFSLFTDVALKEWNEIMSVNLTGAFLYSRSVIPGMIRRGAGRIINISSMWGLVGASCEVAYSTSKAALIGMTRALAKELGPSGITVNAIAPGLIDTDMNRNTLSDEDIAVIVEDTPIGRIGLPLDVAEAALFLCSDKASFVTGDVMNVSGGLVV